MNKKMVLSVDNLHVQIRTPSQTVQAVNGVSFQLESGKVFGIVGESGCGKTLTCLSVMNLLPDGASAVQGSIYLNNKNIFHSSVNEKRLLRGKEIALIMQNPMTAFNPVLTIESHFIETLKSHLPITRNDARELAVKYLQELGLTHPHKLLHQYPFQLSGGMLQRIMIALAVSLQPSLIIADEPTTALDIKNQLRVLDQLNKLRENYGTAILLVSHDLNVVSQLADEVAVMYKGSFVETGSVQNLFENPQHFYTNLLVESRQRLNKRRVRRSNFISYEKEGSC